MSETGKGEMREIYGQRERPLTPLAITQTGFIQQIPPYFSFPLALSQAAVSWSVSAEELGGTEILRKDFINNFSHEFKTPIVSISGFADLLLEEQLLYGDAAPVTGNNAKRSPDTGCPVPGDLCLQNSDHSSKLGSSFRTWISSI